MAAAAAAAADKTVQLGSGGKRVTTAPGTACGSGMLGMAAVAAAAAAAAADSTVQLWHDRTPSRAGSPPELLAGCTGLACPSSGCMAGWKVPTGPAGRGDEALTQR
ncbi:hypothetical protein OEZ86_009442 [Tetradesmus obliquus]|nr:hypothetical protein OEZ86_009442 [Tetradesmus obliquus]